MSKQRRPRGPRSAWEPKPAPDQGPGLATASPLDAALAEVAQGDVAQAEAVTTDAAPADLAAMDLATKDLASTDVAWPVAAPTDVGLPDITAAMTAAGQAEGSGPSESDPSEAAPQADAEPVADADPIPDAEPLLAAEPVAAAPESPREATEAVAVAADESDQGVTAVEAPVAAAPSADIEPSHPDASFPAPVVHDEAEPVTPEPVAPAMVVPEPVASMTPTPMTPTPMASSTPVRSAAAVYWMSFTPERLDLTGIGATITGYMRGESEAAAVYMRALGGARSPADMIRLQVGEFQRAADASLTCWSLVAHKASRAFAYR